MTDLPKLLRRKPRATPGASAAPDQPPSSVLNPSVSVAATAQPSSPGQTSPRPESPASVESSPPTFAEVGPQVLLARKRKPTHTVSTTEVTPPEIAPSHLKKVATQNVILPAVQFDDIPIIDLCGAPVVPSFSAGSLAPTLSRKKPLRSDASLAIFDGPHEDEDDQVQNPALDPEYDLSRVGKLEAMTLLNRGQAEHNRQLCQQKLERHERQFNQEYVKPKQRKEQQFVDETFIADELDRVLKATAESINARVRPFDPARFKIHSVEIDRPLFEPVSNSLSIVYITPIGNALDEIAGKTAQRSAASIKEELDAVYIPVAEFPETPPEADIVEGVQSHFAAATKQISSVIDLTHRESLELVTALASVFVVGLQAPLGEVISRLQAKLNVDALNTAELLVLVYSIGQSRGDASEKSNLRIAATLVVELLRQAQLSTLLRYLADCVSFTHMNYFDDAFVRDAKVCAALADEVEKIECIELRGAVKQNNLPKFARPVSVAKFVKRVTGVVNGLLDESREWLLQNQEVGTHLPVLLRVLRLFADALLTSESGDIAPIEVLWDLFDDIRAHRSPHIFYANFLTILDSNEVTAPFLTHRRRLIAALYACLDQGILPYIILFVIGIPTIRQIPSPWYWKDPASCLKIAATFAPLRHVGFDLNLKDFTAAFDEEFS